MSIQEQLSKQISENKILIFMKGTPEFPQCGFSAAVIDVFKDLKVPFQTVNVLDDPEVREGIKGFSNWPTIPQIYIDGKFVGGCDIVREMHARGELQTLVATSTQSA